MPFTRAIRLAVCALLTVAAAACGPLSVEEERELGVDFSRDFNRRTVLVRDPAVVGYVSAIGRRLLKHAGPQPFTYRFNVVPKGEVNAFAAPAGYIYIYTGTILKARNVSELAGVVAHEIGHVARRHIANNFNRALAANILRQAGAVAAEVVAGPQAGSAAQTLGGLAAMGYLNTFSREAEHEADAFAVQLMFRAGYDPRGLTAFFESLKKQGGASVPGFLRSHPATSARIANTRELIRRLPAGTRLERDDNGRLEWVQQALRKTAGRGGDS